MKWRIWCSVSGGVTGYREAWLKDKGELVEFDNVDAAVTEARKLNNDSAAHGGSVRYSYIARIFVEDSCAY